MEFLKTRNILLIVEGEVTEINVFDKIGDLFFDKTTKLDFFAYKSNIYSLYQKIKEYKEYTTTIDILKEIATDKKSKKLLNKKFSEIYLIFDFDPQEPAYSDKKIIELVNFFNDEIEFGKLYINYPMMESFRDHTNFNIKDFLNRKVKIDGLTSEIYKSYITQNGYKRNIANMTIRHFKLLSKMNIIKSNFIINNSKTMPEYSNFEHISNQLNILMKQIEIKNSTNSIFVLNTCMMFIIDYFGQRYYGDLLKSKV